MLVCFAMCFFCFFFSGLCFLFFLLVCFVLFLQMKNSLRAETGVICTQGECMWLHLDFIEGIIGKVRDIFPTVKYAYTSIPTYPSGQIGFLIASLDANNDVSGT
jgi:spermidine synthase